ncbi:hypothetical protein NKI01_28955 [Mesorhizobium sp. M0815]|uniref:hypothetical protein n=1 Tax=Mesorhizobium sp. M0815 TaxID=2957005 RepID=UPI00333856D4
MSKVAAIDTAVRMQIAADGKKIGLIDTLNIARSGYTDANEVSKFLLGVSRNLKLDMPSRTFRWSTLDPDKLLSKRLDMVIGYIVENTDITEP